MKIIPNTINMVIPMNFIFYCFFSLGVYAADGKIEAGKKLPLLDIGAAYYSNIVLFNHSCAPNTIRINQGNRVRHCQLILVLM